MSDLEKQLEAALRKSVVEIKKLRRQVEELEQQTDDIAIVGMSCRLPGGANSPEEYWDLLSSGTDGISEMPKARWDVDRYYDPDPDAEGKMSTRRGGFIDVVDEFDADFFRISHREAQEIDPQQRLVLELAWEALERAGIAPDSLENSLTGVFMGASFSDYSGIVQASGLNIYGTYSALGINMSALNGRISYTLGLAGPSMTVDTACSSSLVSLDLACKSLQRGDCDLALSGGVYLMLSPSVFVMLSRAKMLAPDGHCKTFDASGDGYARGEGAGMVVLKRLGDAQRDGDSVLAVIRSTAVNQDGPSSGLTVPSRRAQVQLIEKALSDAKLQPTDIGYVEAHGTGTELGDPIEVAAIGDAYGKQRASNEPLLLGSVKSNIGHLEGAAGIAGLIKLVLALENEALAPNLHFKQLNPKIDLDSIPAQVVTELMPWKRVEGQPRRAAISSFGFTGTNAHAIIEEAPLPSAKRAASSLVGILTLSAKSEAALDDLLARYQGYLELSAHLCADICYTSNLGRKHHQHRIALTAQDLDELKRKLRSGQFYRGSTDEGAKVGDLEPEALAQAYCGGAVIDWKAYHEGAPGCKVLLPTYPFQRTQFPLLRVGSEVREDLIYEWTWWPYLLPQLGELNGHYLLIGCDEDIAAAIKKRGGSCQCEPARESRAAYLDLLRGAHYTRIIHGSCLQGLGELDVQSVHDGGQLGAQNVLLLIQALALVDAKERAPLTVLSSRHPAYATLEGLVKTAILEHPELLLRFIEVDRDCASELLLQAIDSSDDEQLLRLEVDGATVPRVQTYSAKPASSPKFDSDATYLITGGLGGLGRELVKWLQEQGAGRLVLTGRRQVEQAELEELRISAAELNYEVLDVANEQAVEALFERLESDGHKLRGIFHLAGLLRDGTLADLDWPQFEAVFESKVYGSLYLHKHAPTLDHFVLYSSAASVLGSPGQANYAAASSFMDALCRYRSERGLAAKSICWGPWAEVGMAKDLAARQERVGLLALPPQAALEALKEALDDAAAHLMIARINWKVYVGHFIQAPSWLNSFAEFKSQQRNLRSAIESADHAQQVAVVAEFVREIVRDVLQLPAGQELSDQTGFFDMGMDSLMSVEIKNRIQAALDEEMSIDVIDLFNHPSVGSLAEYLASFYAPDPEASEEKSREEEISEEVDAMSIEDVIERLKEQSDE